MLRLIGTRVTMSVFSVAVESLGLLKYLGGSTLYKQMSLSIRGGENPALAIAFRVLTNMAIYAMADDDKKADDGMVRISWDIIRLFLPVFLTLPANVIYNLVEN